jgi:putative membrane-bound dehydrogenase-like protein
MMDLGSEGRIPGDGSAGVAGVPDRAIHELLPRKQSMSVLRPLSPLVVRSFRTRTSLLFILLVTGSLPCASPVHAQGYSPQEAVQKMTVPEGFEVRVFASEPMVRQPVAMEFDDRGRLWVIQYLQYPNPEGLQRVEVDRYSRTVYDRVPEPPPHGPRGADRITILEDTTGDGQADSAKDFVDGLNLATGLAFGHGGVFVLQVPYLLYYPDRNQDDVPDGDPEVLVTGFGMEDAHSVANSLTWGPDGWLYGCQGSTVTARIGDIEFQQGVWRYHPILRQFELFCEGGGNSWGLDFDDDGQLLYSTNFGGYRMLHGVQGAYYWKSFGKHGALHNPHAYGYFDHVPHENFRGGHVTVGGIIYRGDSFPREFRGKYIGADLLGHAVYWNDVERRGSTFRSRQGGDLILANDTWFAPTDLTIGPDGAVYVSDWHDQRTAHPDPDAEWDRTNGRIFRIAAKGTPQGELPPWRERSSQELIPYLHHANAWHAQVARRELAARRDPSVHAELRRELLEHPDNHVALRSLWGLYTSGGLSNELALQLLDHRLGSVREWTVRLIGDTPEHYAGIAEEFLRIAETDPDVRVRMQLACTSQRLPVEAAIPLLQRLLHRAEDFEDPYLPKLLWWGVEKHAIPGMETWVDVLTTAEAWQEPLIREVILPRLIQRYVAEKTQAGELACARILAAAPSDQQRHLWSALDAGLGGYRPTLAEPLAQQLQHHWEDSTDDVLLVRLLARTGYSPAQDRCLTIAQNPDAKIAKRIAMLRLMSELRLVDVGQPLLELLRNEPQEEVRIVVIDALAQRDSPEIPSAFLSTFSSGSPSLRDRIATAMFSRPSWAGELLQAIDRGNISAADVALEAVRRVAVHDDAELDVLVRKHWGRLTSGTAEQRLAEVRRLNNDLRAASGRFEAGREVFRQRCAPCHRLHGEGQAVGPDLIHANRKDRDYLLVSIVDPSAVVRNEYASFTLQTVDGQVLTGMIVEQTPQQVTLVDSQGQRQAVSADRIDVIDESPISLMPENLLRELTPQQLRDLFQFLQGDM